MEFWSIDSPTQTLIYTLTISAPVLPEDWLAPLDHAPSNDEPLEELGPIAVTIDKDTPRSPWDTIQNYTAPRTAETWSRRAQVRRARKSNVSGKSGAVLGGGKSPQSPLLTVSSVVKRESSGVSELHQILQPKSNGLTSPSVEQPPQSTAHLVDNRLAVPPSSAVSARHHPVTVADYESALYHRIAAESALYQTAAAVKSAKSAHLSQSHVVRGSSPCLPSNQHNGPLSLQLSTSNSVQSNSPASTDNTSPHPVVNGPITTASSLHSQASGTNGPMAQFSPTGSNGGLPQPSVCKEKALATSSDVRVVGDDAVTATLLFANADSALLNSNSYEVDIVKVNNDQLSVAKEDVVVMETDAATDTVTVTSDKNVSKEVSFSEGGVASVEVVKAETRENSGVVSEEKKEERKGDGEENGSSTVGDKVGADGEELLKVVGGEGSERDKETVGEAKVFKENERERTQNEGSVAMELESSVTTPTTMTTPISASLAQVTYPTFVQVASPVQTTPTSAMNIINSTPAGGLLPLVQSPPTISQSPPIVKSPPTSPSVLYQNMTYVPYISNNHLYLYPVAANSLVDHTYALPHQSHAHLQDITTPTSDRKQKRSYRSPRQQNESSNTKGIKMSKRRRAPKSPPSLSSGKPHPLLKSPTSQNVSSEDAVAQSLCLRRKGAGLPTNPFCLTYTVTSSSGHSWTTDKLEGEGRGEREREKERELYNYRCFNLCYDFSCSFRHLGLSCE